MIYMISIFVWIILSYGLTNIVVFGLIFEEFREFFNKWGNSNDLFSCVGRFIYKILTCPMCFSVYGGVVLSFMTISPTSIFLGVSPIYSWFLDGIFSSGIVWIINTIVEYYEDNNK